jgi:protein subunit release factor A
MHLRKKDFRVDWFSGTGGGGQYRNKHRNCCRITHLETGLRAQETRHRERPTNQDSAFRKLVALIVAHYAAPPEGRRSTTEVVRNYHAERNEVLDKASGLRMEYNKVMNDIAPMIEARAKELRNA